LENSGLVVPALAAALDLTFYEQREQESQLLGYLAGKHLLVILDNAEEILDANLVERMLMHAPAVKMVITTRAALNLQQEWFHPIGGMAVDAMEDDQALAAPGATHADAVALFQQCGQRAHPDFDLTRELLHVQRICRLVDGAPLAIELAAAWLKALPCEQVAQEMARSTDFLATSLRNVPARHRIMRAVLEQSWHYLTVDEKRVFRQLSVFEGGFRPSAAQAVADAPLWVLATLVEKSMLHLAQDGRYRIHALLRQLGVEKLAANPQEDAHCRARHSDYSLTFLRDRSSDIVGPRQQVVLREIQEELDNIRTAWLYAAQQGRLMQMGGAMKRCPKPSPPTAASCPYRRRAPSVRRPCRRLAEKCGYWRRRSTYRWRGCQKILPGVCRARYSARQPDHPRQRDPLRPNDHQETPS
jgi:predicted ATPase